MGLHRQPGQPQTYLPPCQRMSSSCLSRSLPISAGTACKENPPLEKRLAKITTRAVIYKLLFFTLAMIGLPIGTFFLTVHTVFKGSYLYSSSALLSLLSALPPSLITGQPPPLPFTLPSPISNPARQFHVRRRPCRSDGQRGIGGLHHRGNAGGQERQARSGGQGAPQEGPVALIGPGVCWCILH